MKYIVGLLLTLFSLSISAQKSDSHDVVPRSKSPVLAGALSLAVSGVGHFYLGENGQGFAHLAVTGLSLLVLTSGFGDDAPSLFFGSASAGRGGDEILLAAIAALIVNKIYAFGSSIKMAEEMKNASTLSLRPAIGVSQDSPALGIGLSLTF